MPDPAPSDPAPSEPTSDPRAATGSVDLGSLSTACHPVDLAQAMDFARVHYGLSGDFRKLDTEKDDTFLVDTRAGERFILKIANPGETFSELDLQVRALAHLESRAPDLPVPRVIADRRGDLLSTFAAPDGTRLTRLMSYLSGTVLDTLPPEAEEQRQIGQMAARLRLALADFEHAGADRILAWDVRHLPDLGSLLGHVHDPDKRQDLDRAFARFCTLRDRIDALPRQIVHNDFSRSNLLVDRSRAEHVVGIIDFGDTVRTAVAIDLSTALLNQLPRGPHEYPDGDMIAGALRLLHGYLEIAPLTQEERALLPHLVMGRIVVRALLSLWRADRFPENRRYILRNTEQGWAQLNWFLARSPDALSALFL